MSHYIDTFAHRCCDDTIALAEKCEKNQSQTYSEIYSSNTIGESYYRLAIFGIKHSKTSDKFETGKLLIKSILRGMRLDSKNARLQFPRLLQLPNINTIELTSLFNEEVSVNSQFYRPDGEESM